MFDRLVRTPVRTNHLEKLEDRTLLSAMHHGGLIRSITFDQAPAVVQTGLDTLAGTTVDSTTNVYLGNRRGVETYTIDISSAGTNSVYTVDQKGNPVTAPMNSSTTFGAITNTVVTTELATIATALNATAPASTDNVNVLTNADSSATYSMSLAITTSSGRTCHVNVSVDSVGDPTGNESLPLSVFSAAIQNGLTTNSPAGSTPLTSTSQVKVRTLNGITTYSATYQSTGVSTTVSVDSTGALTNLPTTSTAQFSTIPAPAQTELQTLATANGFVGTIDPTANVKVYDEANGTVIYAVKLPVSGTGKSGSTYTYMIAVAADQNGNPTVPPNNGWGGFGGWDGGWGGWGGWSGSGGFGPGGWNFGGHCGGGGDSGGGTSGTGGTDGDGPGGGTTGGTTGSSGASVSTAYHFSGFSQYTRKLGFRF